MKTRQGELMWTASPISTSYSDPYLLVYTEKSVDIYDVLSGIWLQSLPLSNTYPLTVDGSISFSHDPELDKHHAKLIYITPQNRSTLSLNIQEKSPLKHAPSRNSSRRSPMFSTMKSTKQSPDASWIISEATDFRHVEHLGVTQAREILSHPNYAKQNNTHLSSTNGSHFSDENGTLTRSSHSRKSDTSLPSSYNHLQSVLFC
jgi:hypothetical protein